jgi:hypothetical protein
MRDEWYGDKRDLVKWGVLLHLAKQHGVKMERPGFDGGSVSEIL